MLKSRLGTFLLAASLPLTGCVCDSGGRAAPPSRRPRELAFWDFAHQPELSKLDLWPAGAGAPKRKKHELETSEQGTDLVVTADGSDPFLIWDLETPLSVGVVSLEISSEMGGELQLFWATPECKVYQERCSTRAELGAGRQLFDFVIEQGNELRGIRLDLPGVRGEKLTLHRVRLLERARLSMPFEPRADHTEVAATPNGLRITCKTPDPWMVFPTPWLVTDQVESIEVEMHAPPDTIPQLYWRGSACSDFAESCKALLKLAPGRKDLFVATLAGAPNWSGQAPFLRFDPGDLAGEYVLRSLTLVRRGSK